jgi:phage tail-like protein
MPISMPTAEDTRTPFGNFAFYVSFEPSPDSTEFAAKAGVPDELFGGFQEISGLEAMMEHKAIKEGGLNYGTHMRAGPVTFGTVVLKRGMVSARHLWRWWAMFAGADGADDGLPTPDYRANVLIGLIGTKPAKEADKKKDDGGYHYANSTDDLWGTGIKASVRVDATSSFDRKPAEAPPPPPEREIKLGWRLRNAMPIKFRAGDLNAKGSEIAIEELHLVHEGLDMSGVLK